MSTAQLQVVLTKKILAIQDECLLQQVLEFLQSKPPKVQKTKQQMSLPPHIKQGIGESLEAYSRGEYTSLETNQEIDEYLENLIA